MRVRDTPSLPVGKLPPEMLTRLLAAAPVQDPRVLVEESCAVAEAAMASGVAREPIADFGAYRKRLTEMAARLGS